MTSSANLATLRELRGNLRYEWLARLPWESVTTFNERGRPGDEYCAVTFRAGKHITPTGRSVRDFTPDARALLMVLMHMFAIATGAKSNLHVKPPPAPKAPRKRAPPRGAVAEDEPAADELNAQAAATLAAAAAAVTAKKEAPYKGHVYVEYLYKGNCAANVVIALRIVFQLRKTVAVAAQGPAAAAEPATDAASEEDHAPPPVAVVLAPPPLGGDPDPFSQALLVSCAEAKWLNAQLAKERAKAQNARGAKRRKVNDQSVAAAGGGAEQPPLQPKDTIAWSWAAYETPTKILFGQGPVRNYFADVACAKLTHLAYILDRAGAIRDPRPFFNSDLRSREWDDERSPQLYAYDKTFALRQIFTWETAMVYFTKGVARDQCKRANYFPDAGADDDDDDSDDEPESQLMEEDDPANNELLLGVNSQDELVEENDAAWPKYAMRAFRRLSEPIRTRGRVIHWPRPGTTYVLNPMCVSPEALAQIPFPHPMGAELSQGVMMTTGIFSIHMPIEEKRVTLAVKYLRMHEQRLRGTIDAGMLLQSFSLSDEAIAAHVTPQEVQRVILREEKGIVETALVDMQREASACQYKPLLLPALADGLVAPSTHDQMGTLDFVPWEHKRAQGDTTLDSVTMSRAVWQPVVLKELQSVNMAPENMTKFMTLLTGKVDVIDKDFLKRDDFLALRLRMQAQFATLRQAYANPAFRTAGHTGRQFRTQFWELVLAGAREMEVLLRTSDNLPEVVKGPLRDFLESSCFAREDAPAPAPRPRCQQAMNQRPMTLMMQEVGDIIAGLQHASPQAYPAGMLGFFCMLDTWTYEFDRSMPGLNLLYGGKTGVGKSFVMNQIIKALSVPGIVRGLTNITTQAMNTDTSYDHVVFVFEEMKSSWLFATGSDKDKGASQEINMNKQRQTSFCTEVIYTWTDDATGKRLTLTSKASHHNITLAGTNQFLSDMDEPTARRYIVYFMPRHVAAGEGGGSDNFDQNGFSAFCDSEKGRRTLHAMHRVYAAFAYVKLLEKCGVIPRVSRSAAEFQLDAVLADMQRQRFVSVADPTRRHHVLQLACNIQTFFACWQALEGPISERLLPLAQRWTPEGMVTTIVPFMAPGKEALMAALTMLEFEYTPVYVEHLLRALATDCLHLDQAPEHWQFRGFKEGPNNDDYRWDCNYVVLPGRSAVDICDAVTRHNKEFEIRKEDVLKFLNDLSKDYITCEGLVRNGEGDAMQHYRPQHITSVTEGQHGVQMRKVLLFEEDGMKPNTRNQRLCVLVRFLEERLGVVAGDAVSVGALRMTRKPLEPAEALDPGKIATHCTLVADQRSALAGSLARVLSHPKFELDPTLGDNVDEDTASLPFFTAYMPAPIVMYATPPAQPGEKRRERVVSMHGTHLLMSLWRNPRQALLRHENHTQPTATAKRTFARFAGDEAETKRARVFDNAAGMVAGKCDVDSTFMREWQHSICHPGLPVLDALYRAAPGTPGATDLAYNYGPVLNRIYRHVAEKTGDDLHFEDYPFSNVLGRIQQAAHLVDKQSTLHDVDDLAGRDTYGGLSLGGEVIVEAMDAMDVDEPAADFDD